MIITVGRENCRITFVQQKKDRSQDIFSYLTKQTEKCVTVIVIIDDDRNEPLIFHFMNLHKNYFPKNCINLKFQYIFHLNQYD